jgi:hypothetical protein
MTGGTPASGRLPRLPPVPAQRRNAHHMPQRAAQPVAEEPAEIAGSARLFLSQTYTDKARHSRQLFTMVSQEQTVVSRPEWLLSAGRQNRRLPFGTG